jgi:hypothetical protein
MSALPKPLDVHLDKVEFAFGGLFTFDAWQSEAELGPIPMMAYFYKLRSGAVSVASLWVNEGTKTKPQWIDVRLPKFQVELIERSIAAGVEKEQSEDSKAVVEA